MTTTLRSALCCRCHGDLSSSPLYSTPQGSPAFAKSKAMPKSSWANSHMGYKWAALARPFSSRPAGNDIIGINLGITNSCVAIMEGKNSKAIENAEEAQPTLSVVAFNQKAETLVATPVGAPNGDAWVEDSGQHYSPSQIGASFE